MKNTATLKVDISDRNTHFDLLIDILTQLEKLGWDSFEETKEEWTTLLMCARENPELFPMKKSKKKKIHGIITGDEITY